MGTKTCDRSWIIYLMPIPGHTIILQISLTVTLLVKHCCHSIQKSGLAHNSLGNCVVFSYNTGVKLQTQSQMPLGHSPGEMVNNCSKR